MSEKTKPEIVVFAGPNGSGKSDYTETLRPVHLEYINADELKKVLKCTDKDAAIEAGRQRGACLSELKGCCFETVMSNDRNINFLKRAKEKGDFIKCYYMLAADTLII